MLDVFIIADSACLRDFPLPHLLLPCSTRRFPFPLFLFSIFRFHFSFSRSSLSRGLPWLTLFVFSSYPLVWLTFLFSLFSSHSLLSALPKLSYLPRQKESRTVRTATSAGGPTWRSAPRRIPSTQCKYSQMTPQ